MNWHKFEKMMEAAFRSAAAGLATILAVLLIVFMYETHADETLKEHYEYHKALETAVNHVDCAKGVTLAATRQGKYGVRVVDGELGAFIMQPTIHVICVGGSGDQVSPPPVTPATPEPEPEPVAQVLIGVRLTWSPPDARENGTALDPYEISHYEIYVYDQQGELETFAVDGGLTEWEQDMAPGVYQISMLAVDSEGLRSDLTLAVETTVSE